MNETLKAVVRILEVGTPELKVAASQVLGELAPRQPAVVEGLAGALTLGDNTLNRYILQSLAQIGSPAAIRVLIGRLRDGGATADLVRHLLSTIGGEVTVALAGCFAGESPELRAQILQILGHYSEDPALGVLLDAMLADDGELSSQACAFLLARIDEVDAARQKAYREEIYARISKGSEELSPAALACALEAIGHIDAAASRATLLKFAGDKFPAIVRKAALDALADCRLTPKQADDLLGYLEDADVEHVVKPALRALAGHTEWDKASIARLREYLGSRREEMKLFAMRALQDTPLEAVVQVYFNHINSPNPEFRAAAVAALGKNPKAIPILLKSLQHERNAEKAAVLIRPLLAQAERIKASQVKAMCEKCGRLLGAADKLGEVHLELLLGLDAKVTSEELIEKAMRLRRARKLTEALNILVHLARSKSLDIEGRYQLALARLIKDHEEGRAALVNHTGDATMGYIAGLVRDRFPVFERLKKESMLAPEDLLRVGRHFNASIGPEQRLGTDMLVYVAEKHARLKAGEEARMMIRSEGLA